MVNYRTLLAVLIALAVAMAPVSMALAACQTAAKAEMAGQADMQDCQGTGAANSPDGNVNGKCPIDGSMCCQLTGTLATLPMPIVLAAAAFRVAEPQEPSAWAVEPHPPPPRS